MSFIFIYDPRLEHQSFSDRTGRGCLRSVVLACGDQRRRVVSKRHHRELRIHPDAAREDTRVADEEIVIPIHLELRIDDTDIRLLTDRVAALRMASTQCDIARILDEFWQFSQLVHVLEFVVVEGVWYYKSGAAVEKNLAGKYQPGDELIQIRAGWNVIDYVPTRDELIQIRAGWNVVDFSAGESGATSHRIRFGADENSCAGYAVISPHIVVMILKPTRHRKCLCKRRIEPRLHHVAARWRELQVVRDLKPLI